MNSHVAQIKSVASKNKHLNTKWNKMKKKYGILPGAVLEPLVGVWKELLDAKKPEGLNGASNSFDSDLPKSSVLPS